MYAKGKERKEGETEERKNEKREIKKKTKREKSCMIAGMYKYEYHISEVYVDPLYYYE